MAQASTFGPCPASARILSVGFQCGSINCLVGTLHALQGILLVHDEMSSGLKNRELFCSGWTGTLEVQSWPEAVLAIDLFQRLTSHFCGFLNSEKLELPSTRASHFRISACNRCQWEDLKNIVQSECHWPKHWLSNQSAWIFAGNNAAAAQFFNMPE